jgi:hypothetical protein
MTGTKRFFHQFVRGVAQTNPDGSLITSGKHFREKA